MIEESVIKIVDDIMGSGKSTWALFANYRIHLMLFYNLLLSDIRSNFNRYCRNEFQRLDANLICKLCNYFEWTFELYEEGEIQYCRLVDAEMIGQ